MILNDRLDRTYLKVKLMTLYIVSSYGAGPRGRLKIQENTECCHAISDFFL